jgi:lipopolysaccharide biosynthesis glycosyltransferase
MKTYNIAISTSKTYSPFAKVMLNSFYKTHPNAIINLYLFYLDPSILELEVDLLNFAKKHNKINKVDFVKINYSELEIVDNKKGWAIDLWCRWYLLDYLIDICDRVLILGVDTMLQDNIEEFYFQDLTNFYFACAPDMYINNTDSSKWPLIKKDMDKYGLKDKSKYINGDVVLVNLNETKNKLTFLDFLKLFQANQFTCWDQDVISYCFNDKIKYQNYLLYNYFPNLSISKINDKDFGVKAKIIHFAGGPKPWNVSICLANNYFGIPKWWKYSRDASVSKIKFPFLYCFFSMPFNFFKNKFLNIFF